MKWVLGKKINTYGWRWKMLCIWPLSNCASSPPPWLVAQAAPIFSCVWNWVCFGQITAGVHCSFSGHGRPAAELAVGSFSHVDWPSGHHHPTCPLAHSFHPGLPQRTQAYNSPTAIRAALMLCAQVSTPSLSQWQHTVIKATTVWVFPMRTLAIPASRDV